MKYNVYDKNGVYLGVIWAPNETEALKDAQEFDMPTATRVELRADQGPLV